MSLKMSFDAQGLLSIEMSIGRLLGLRAVLLVTFLSLLPLPSLQHAVCVPATNTPQLNSAPLGLHTLAQCQHAHEHVLVRPLRSILRGGTVYNASWEQSYRDGCPNIWAAARVGDLEALLSGKPCCAPLFELPLFAVAHASSAQLCSSRHGAS